MDANEKFVTIIGITSGVVIVSYIIAVLSHLI